MLDPNPAWLSSKMIIVVKPPIRNIHIHHTSRIRSWFRSKSDRKRPYHNTRFIACRDAIRWSNSRAGNAADAPPGPVTRHLHLTLLLQTA